MQVTLSELCKYSMISIFCHTAGFISFFLSLFLFAAMHLAILQTDYLQLQLVSYLMVLFLLQTIGSFQKKYNIGSFELLSKTAPVQAASLLIVGPFADYYLNHRSLLEYRFTSGATVSSISIFLLSDGTSDCAD